MQRMSMKRREESQTCEQNILLTMYTMASMPPATSRNIPHTCTHLGRPLLCCYAYWLCSSYSSGTS